MLGWNSISIVCLHRGGDVRRVRLAYSVCNILNEMGRGRFGTGLFHACPDESKGCCLDSAGGRGDNEKGGDVAQPGSACFSSCSKCAERSGNMSFYQCSEALAPCRGTHLDMRGKKANIVVCSNKRECWSPPLCPPDMCRRSVLDQWAEERSYRASTHPVRRSKRCHLFPLSFGVAQCCPCPITRC
jgi:hypothetical protein